ncbi:TlpA disulfide reductase family protein [Sphaerotilus mobilis]|uniref:Thiol-disulfide isomerase/thioredoxin n=1 Tax=Sphaerotilus mobilis TaxID=47994 RepID=A0A4Q7LUU0_9BURK|nr:TlpA disulfide reductase family protein [Sphaerotilus mobilis]RZS58341.1 thiol-disulfide isomerase/thioredoxin [Sphaerotilus mobilis]
MNPEHPFLAGPAGADAVPTPDRRRLLHLGFALLTASTLPDAVPAAALETDPPGAHRTPWPPALPTPTLELPTWEGPVWRLADARGQVVIINFWATWCEPCREELPSLELLAQRHVDDRVQVITVNHRETDATLRRYLAADPLTLPVLRDRDGAASRAWTARVFPTTVVVDRQGRAAFSVIGELDWAGSAPRRWLRDML